MSQPWELRQGDAPLGNTAPDERSRLLPKLGRQRPHSAREIARGRCYRCHDAASHSWSLDVCAAGEARWFLLCRGCDVAMNEIVLHWLGVSNADALVARYRRKVARWRKNLVAPRSAA